MLVTGYRHIHVAVLINGNDDRYYRVEYDPELAGDVLAMARTFWQRIQDGSPPPIDGSAAVTELLVNLWDGEDGSAKVIAPGEVEGLLAERKRLKADAKALEVALADAENHLKAMLGEAEIAISDGGPLYTWKQNGNFAAKRFEEAHPDLAAKYTHLAPAIDTKTLAAEHPDIYRAFRARVLRVPGGTR